MPDPEDVVVGAEGDQEHSCGEGDVERQSVVAKQVLEHPGGQPQGGAEREHARGQKVQGQHQGPQEEHEQQEVHRQDGQRDPSQVGPGGRGQQGRQRRVTTEGGLGPLQARLVQQVRQRLLQPLERGDGGSTQWLVGQHDEEACGVPAACENDPQLLGEEVLPRAQHAGDPWVLLEELTQPGEAVHLGGDALALHQEHRRRQDALGESLGRRLRGHRRLTGGRQGGHEGDTQGQVA